ncbi:MAG: arginyltransferase [Proteobacteria bacterium]|nr:arginyltransferase [Pseudomonadota bacterium]MCP4922025.1 arginyltransferase [Pseudomonadota bacterium]
MPSGIPVDQTPHPCPYLPGREAVLPLRWYREPIEPREFDRLLAHADRRVGRTMYRPSCPSCTECKGIRVPISEFEPSKSQRKAWRRNQDVRVLAGPPKVDDEHLALFNRHKLERGLSDRPTSAGHYRNWLTVTCTRTIETRYLVGDKLIGVGIVDLGDRDASSVYFYFDPDEDRRSLGVFSVLAEIAWLKSKGYRYYYLGLYVKDCAQLSYKARYTPHERLEDGVWVRHG